MRVGVTVSEYDEVKSFLVHVRKILKIILCCTCTSSVVDTFFRVLTPYFGIALLNVKSFSKWT